jgi:CHAD domain-containing protein
MSEAVDPTRPLDEEFRRIAGNLLDSAVAALSHAHADPNRGPHQARRSLKDMRALLRLVRPADEVFFQRENARYRDIARSLAGVRAAAALVETIDRLVADFPEETAGGGLSTVRSRLAADRDRATVAEGNLAAIAEDAVSALRAGGEALGDLMLPILPEASVDVLTAGMTEVAGKAARMRKRARKSRAALDFHELRKAVKQHWAHVGLLSSAWPKHGTRRIKAARRLGNRLGELHDITVMRSLIAADPAGFGPAGEVALLKALMDRKEAELERKSLASAKRLFGAKPARLARKLKRNYLRAARKAERERSAPALWRTSGKRRV